MKPKKSRSAARGSLLSQRPSQNQSNTQQSLGALVQPRTPPLVIRRPHLPSLSLFPTPAPLASRSRRDSSLRRRANALWRRPRLRLRRQARGTTAPSSHRLVATSKETTSRAARAPCGGGRRVSRRGSRGGCDSLSLSALSLVPSSAPGVALRSCRHHGPLVRRVGSAVGLRS